MKALDAGFLDYLCCPACRGELKMDAKVSQGSSVVEGVLTCSSCGRTYPIRRGIPRFVGSDDYLHNFTMEWTIHSETPFDESLGDPVNEYMYKTRIGFSSEDVKGKVVLDAGCGSGRYVGLMRRFGATAVGLDYSFAIDSAAKNTWPDEKVHLVQGDILNPPFKEGSFDRVFSSGVIHHTPNPPLAFSKLSKLVKAGGGISVWVYPDEGVLGKIPNRVAAIYRAVGKRVPPRALYRVCKALQENIVLPQAVYEDFFDVDKSYAKGHHNPRQALYVLVPFWSLAPYKEWRVMDTFDFLSPKYKFAYSYAQVERWFSKEGLVRVERSPFPVGAKGWKA